MPPEIMKGITCLVNFLTWCLKAPIDGGTVFVADSRRLGRFHFFFIKPRFKRLVFSHQYAIGFPAFLI